MIRLGWLAGAAIVLTVPASSCRRASAEDATDPDSLVHVDGPEIRFDAKSPQLAAIVSSPVTRRDVDSVRVAGRLAWDEDATVRIFSPFAGRIASVRADVGRAVRAADTLALVESPDFGQAQADERRAATDLAMAKRNAERARDLFEHHVVARKDVEAADADVARAATEHQRALERVAQYGGDTMGVTQLFPLRSPIAGVVVDRNVTPGQEVRPDQMLANAPQLFAPLFTVTDPARLWVLLDLPERDIAIVHVGSRIAIRPQAMPSRVFAGSVTSVAGAVDPATRTVHARGAVANPDALLRAEMLVTVETSTPASAALAVPVGAALLDGDHYVVFVDEGRGRFRRTPVTTAAQQDGMVEITRGLTSGDRVVTTGALLLEDLYQSKIAG